MKKLIIFFILLMFSHIEFTQAHPGNTASDGCHYCRTNCDYRGVSRNQRHCHGGGSSYSPTTCPLNSYQYGSSCICNTGYYSNGTSCVKEKTCSDLYGYNSKNNYDGTCSCMTGYSFGTDYLGNKTCISDDTLCQNDFGYGAESIGDGYCGCKSGYIMGLNSLGKKECNSGYTYCSLTYGVNSKFNLLSNSCECYSGYEWNSDKTSCVKINKCGINSYYDSINNSCKCNSGYTWKDASDNKNYDCIKKRTYTEICQETYGLNSYGDEKYCYCNSGYEWNFGKTSCIIKEKTAIEMCQESYGLNSTSDGIKNNDGTYNCSCKSGYEWNSNKTSCLIKVNSLSSNTIDKNKQTAEILFNKIKTKTSNFSQDKKDKVYKSLLEKIEVLRSKSKGDTLKILDYLKDFINNEKSETLDDLFGDLFDE